VIWGETIYGEKGGIKKISQTQHHIVILARDDDYIDHTRIREPLTPYQLEIRLQKNAEKTLL